MRADRCGSCCFRSHVTGPNGSTFERTLLSGYTLDAGATTAPTFALRVPPAARHGLYTATVTALEGGTTLLASATFTFEVVAPEAGAEPAASDCAPWPVAVLDDGGLGGAEAHVAGAVELMPSAYALARPSPNPFTGRTRIAFALPEPAHVRLPVYDLLGLEVAVLVDGEQEAGHQEAVLDAATLPAGVYLVRMTAGPFVQTHRVTLVR